jgi:hypothetical protein
MTMTHRRDQDPSVNRATATLKLAEYRKTEPGPVEEFVFIPARAAAS